MVCQDSADSLFECPNVVYVGIAHGHQLLCVAMAVLHNTHTRLSRFKLLEKTENSLGQIPQEALRSSEILYKVPS